MNIILPDGTTPADESANNEQQQGEKQEQQKITIPSPAVVAKFYGLPTSPIQQHPSWEFDSAAKLFHPPLDLIFYHAAVTCAALFQAVNSDVLPRVMLLIKDVVIMQHTVKELEKRTADLTATLDTSSQTIN